MKSNACIGEGHNGAAAVAGAIIRIRGWRVRNGIFEKLPAGLYEDCWGRQEEEVEGFLCPVCRSCMTSGLDEWPTPHCSNPECDWSAESDEFEDCLEVNPKELVLYPYIHRGELNLLGFIPESESAVFQLVKEGFSVTRRSDETRRQFAERAWSEAEAVAQAAGIIHKPISYRGNCHWWWREEEG